ncbi:MAG TPA: hypothetical protein P5058_02630 [Eubacteriales bacterium]|nr:hypothetical protein [Eubacteriales bacterium]
MDELKLKREIKEQLTASGLNIKLPGENFWNSLSVDGSLAVKAYAAIKAALLGLSLGEGASEVKGDIALVLKIWGKALLQENEGAAEAFIRTLSDVAEKYNSREVKKVNIKETVKAYLTETIGCVRQMQRHKSDFIFTDEQYGAIINSLLLAANLLNKAVDVRSPDAVAIGKKMMSVIERCRTELYASTLTPESSRTLVELISLAESWGRLANVTQKKDASLAAPAPDMLHFYVRCSAETEPQLNQFFKAVDHRINKVDEIIKNYDRNFEEKRERLKEVYGRRQSGEIDKASADREIVKLGTELKEIQARRQDFEASNGSFVKLLKNFRDRLEQIWFRLKNKDAKFTFETLGLIDYAALMTALTTGAESSAITAAVGRFIDANNKIEERIAADNRIIALLEGTGHKIKRKAAEPSGITEEQKNASLADDIASEFLGLDAVAPQPEPKKEDLAAADIDVFAELAEVLKNNPADM